MLKTLTITRRELNSYFLSHLAYGAGTLFLLVTGVFYYLIVIGSQQVTLRYVFNNMSVILLFVSPFLTMRMMSEEFKSGTIEALTTVPVTDTQVVLGKFLGGMVFYIILILPTLVYAGILAKVGSPDWGPIITGYIGLLLLGTMFISVGLLMSCLTKDQLIAAEATFVILLILWVIGFAVPESTSALGRVVKYIAIFDHFDTFQKGLIDSRDVVYYLTNTAVFLFLSVKVVESRKWR